MTAFLLVALFATVAVASALTIADGDHPTLDAALDAYL